MRRLLEFLTAVVLRGILGRAERPPRRAARRAPAAAPPSPAVAPSPPGKRALVPLGFLAAGVLLMIPFEAWFTLLAGVLALFAFIVSGVFLIAAPALLNQEDDAE
jgi:hypothetical protein